MDVTGPGRGVASRGAWPRACERCPGRARRAPASPPLDAMLRSPQAISGSDVALIATKALYSAAV